LKYTIGGKMMAEKKPAKKKAAPAKKPAPKKK
jgi:hypothetical protein